MEHVDCLMQKVINLCQHSVYTSAVLVSVSFSIKDSCTSKTCSFNCVIPKKDFPQKDIKGLYLWGVLMRFLFDIFLRIIGSNPLFSIGFTLTLTELNSNRKQAELEVPHSEIQVELDWQLHYQGFGELGGGDTAHSYLGHLVIC